MDENTLQQINHFLQCACVGHHGGASSGERAAHEIAQTLHASMIDHVASLDSQAVEGICQLIRYANCGGYSTVMTLLSSCVR